MLKEWFSWISHTFRKNAGKLIKHLNKIINSTPGKKRHYLLILSNTPFLIYGTGVWHSL